jgi:hypothetical protein
VIVLVSGRSMQARSTALVVDDALPAGFEIETTLGADDAQNGPFKFLGELTNGRCPGKPRRPLHRRAGPGGQQALRPGLCGAGRDAGRVLPARRRGQGHVPAQPERAVGRRRG